MTEYLIGTQVQARVTFTDVTGTPTDPTVITFRLENGAGVLVTETYGALGAAITRVSAGVYTRPVSLNTGGGWAWRWVGTGALEAAVEGVFLVQTSTFPS